MTWLLSHQRIRIWRKSKLHMGMHQRCLTVAFSGFHILQSTSILIVKPFPMEEDVEDLDTQH